MCGRVRVRKRGVGLDSAANERERERDTHTPQASKQASKEENNAERTMPAKAKSSTNASKTSVRRKKPDTKRFDRHLSAIAKSSDAKTNLSADMVHVWGELTKIVLHDLTDAAAQVRDFGGAKTLSARHYMAAITTLFPPGLAEEANEAGKLAVVNWSAKK